MEFWWKRRTFQGAWDSTLGGRCRGLVVFGTCPRQEAAHVYCGEFSSPCGFTFPYDRTGGIYLGENNTPAKIPVSVADIISICFCQFGTWSFCICSNTR